MGRRLACRHDSGSSFAREGWKARDGVQLTLSVLERATADGGLCAPTLLTGRFLGSHHRPKHSASDLLDTRVILVCASEVF